MSSNIETKSTTSTDSATPFVYLKGSVDYSDFAIEFLSDEKDYYDYIKSYTTEYEVILYIRENGIVEKCAKYYNNGKLTELETDKDFDTILDWVSDYKGEAVSINFVLDTVYIGEDLVPLWKILIDAHNEDDEDEEEYNKKELEGELSLHASQLKLIHMLMNLYLLLFAIYLLVNYFG